MKPRDLNAELTPVTGLGKCDMTDMKLDVEVRVFDPVGMVEAHRHANDALPERAREMKACFVVFEDALEAEHAPFDRRLVVNRQAADVHGCIGRLEIEKRRIHRAELFHGSVLPAAYLGKRHRLSGCAFIDRFEPVPPPPPRESGRSSFVQRRG